MARHRRFRTHKHHKSGGFMSVVHKLIVPASFGVAFTAQVSAKDIQNYGQTNFNALPNMEKGKFMANSLIGHVTNYNPFPQYGTSGITINPTGPINKYTGMGIGLMVLSQVLPKGFGGRTMAKKFGKGLFWGGVVGGFLDPSTGARTGVQGRAVGGTKAIGATNTPMKVMYGGQSFIG